MRFLVFCSFAEEGEQTAALSENILERSARAGHRATLVRVAAVKLTRCKNDADR